MNNRPKKSKDNSPYLSNRFGCTIKSIYDQKARYEALSNAEKYIKKSKMEKELHDIRKEFLATKLKKLMAVRILKNNVEASLKRYADQVDSNRQNSKTGEESHNSHNSKDFIVLGGGLRSLDYVMRKDSKGGKSNAFTIEVDVKGYITDNVSIDTENAFMSIRAVKVNGTTKALRILAPSVEAMDKIKIHTPKGGILIIQYAD